MSIIHAEKNPNGMNIIEIIEVIQLLSHSQGFYGRLLERILDAKANDPDSFEGIKKELESQNFKDSVDVVMYFET